MSRFSILIKTKLNKLLNRLEDPEETLDFAYEQQLESIQHIRRGIADVVTAKKRLELQSKKLDTNANKLEQQARAAVSSGNDDLARLALERKRNVTFEKENLDHQISELSNQQQALVDKQEELKTKVEHFRVKKEVVKAQYAAASAQVNVAELTNGIGGNMNNLAMSLERANDRVEQMKARAAATEELEASGAFDDVLSLGSGMDDIDRALASNTGNSIIDAELGRLKEELTLEPSQKTPKALEE